MKRKAGTDEEVMKIFIFSVSRDEFVRMEGGERGLQVGEMLSESVV